MSDYNELYEEELRKDQLDENKIDDNNGNKKNLFPYNLLILFMFAILVFAIIYTKFLPLKIEFLIIVIAAVIAIIGLAIKRRWIKVTSSIFILLIAGLIFYGHFKINSLTNEQEHVTHTMSLLVMEDSPIENIDGARGKSFGYSSDINDLLWEDFKDKSAEDLNALDNLTSYDDSLELTDNLYSGNIDVMILDEASRGNILENYPDFDSQTRILKDFKIEEEIEVVAPKKADVVNESFIAYISGVDTSGSISSNSRSDVNILAVVNPNTHKILLVSIPRDTYLAIPEFDGNKDKITHTGLYGVRATMDALEDFFYIDINYYAKFNFTSVINIIDIIGEVDVYSHYDFTADGHNFNRGINSMDGQEALAFVRERKSLPGGDTARGVHQMELIKGVINTAIEPQNLLKLGGVIDEVAENLSTNMSTDEVSSLIAFQLDGNEGWEFEQMQLEGFGKIGKYSYLMPNQDLYVMDPDQDSVDEIIDRINQVFNEE